MGGYKAGMEEWLGHVEKNLTFALTQYSKETLERDRKLAVKLASSETPSELLNRLGDRSFGIGGTDLPSKNSAN